MASISDNLSHIHQEIDKALSQEKSGRKVRLLCVSKTKPDEMIKEAYAAGERCFGESYATEACDKIERLKAAGLNDIEWHFIGPVQKNKTRQIAAHFDVVESLDREIIADRLSEQRPEGMKPLEVYIEVNISGEEQKSGCAPDDAEKLIAHVRSKPNLRFTGLMGIAQDTADQQKILQEFSMLRDMFVRLKKSNPELVNLSIGMTHDLKEAIACGSTEVRIGTAIFGPRVYAQPRLGDSAKLSFIGGGNMASCIFRSVLKHCSPRNITVSGPHVEKLEHFRQDGAAVTSDNLEAARAGSVIFLGVKPQVLTGVLEELAASGTDFSDKLVISMAAGYKLSSISRILHSERLVRIMPNTPASLGEGVTAVAYGSGVSAEDKELVRLLLDGMGKSVEGSEQDLNVIGVIAGCGPAFVYRFMESLISESVKHGLDEQASREIVEQLLKGSADMVIHNQDTPVSKLREAVTSKGGTTFAGLTKMTEGHFEDTMHEAVEAALKRTAEFESMY